MSLLGEVQINYVTASFGTRGVEPSGFVSKKSIILDITQSSLRTLHYFNTIFFQCWKIIYAA
jgi:hypothetical protein